MVFKTPAMQALDDIQSPVDSFFKKRQSHILKKANFACSPFAQRLDCAISIKRA